MKNIYLIIFFLSLQGILYAQNDCGLYLTTTFESQCLYGLDKDHINDEEPCFQACKGSQVIYKAHGVSNVSSYNWEITGASSYQPYSNNGVKITWANDVENGAINVQALDASGNVLCSYTQCIEIKSDVQAMVTSMPIANEVHDHESFLDICLGQTVEFFDESYSAPETPIVGYIWYIYGYNESEIITTQNFTYTFEEPGEYKLVHEAINECGCKDEYYYLIRVQEKPSLELNCYGTACANSEQTYVLNNAECGQYIWEITGGTLIDFHYPELTIQWGNPSSGMGIIRLSGQHCEGLCEEDAYINIPIIADNVSITGGADVLCEDELVIYELPIWAATEYNWHISPQTGVQIFETATPNKLAVSFETPGIYTISADYVNEVLPDCGTHHALPREIVVKPKLNIEGENLICLGNSANFQLNMNSTVLWKIYNSSNNVIYTTNSNAINYNFPQTGAYKITAESNAFCNVAEYIVSVKPSPSQLSINDVSGKLSICPFSTYTYEVASSPYDIIWECESATPSLFTGNEYVASFDTEISSIFVKQEDPVTGCVSEPLEYPIHSFELNSINLNVPEVCANGTFHLEFEEQEGVTYEWSIIPNNAASILGDVPDGTSHDILVNNTNLNQFNIKIKRRYCNSFVDEVYIPVNVIPLPEPQISYPEEICQNSQITVNIDNFQTNGTYELNYNDQIYSPEGNAHNIIFTVQEAGNFNFSVAFHSNAGCISTSTEGYGYANAVPNVSGSKYLVDGEGTYLTISQQGDVNNPLSYQWSHTDENSATVLSEGSGVYTCVVTNDEGCSKTVTITLSGSSTPSATHPLNVSIEQDGCGHVHLEADNVTNNNILWTGTEDASVSLSGEYSEIIDMDFSQTGFYDISASSSMNGEIWATDLSIAIPLIIRFDVEKSCASNGQVEVTIHDESDFMDGVNFSNEHLTLNGSTVSSPMLLNENSTYTLTMYKTYSFTNPVNNEVLTGTCSVSQTIDIPAQLHADFTIQGGNSHCQETEVHFINQSTGNVVQSYWDFEDNSNILQSGLVNGIRAYPEPNPSSTNFGKPHYTVTLQIKDAMGCIAEKQKDVIIKENKLKVIAIGTESDNKVCDGSDRNIKLVVGNADFLDPYQTTDHYEWMPNVGNTIDNTYNTVQHTNDYQVHAYNNWGCEWTSPYKNIGFLPTPQVSIEGLSEICKGENIELKGDIGNNFDYHWTLQSPQGDTYTYDEADITHYMNTSGTWTATLTVSYTESSTTCSDEVTHSIVVHPKGNAPTLAWGENQCLFSGAVDVVSNSGSVYWSNGDVGTHSQYITPGFLTAYQINEYGCKSSLATKYIKPAPDMHFVLSGCYEVCREFFLGSPSIYSFITPMPSHWSWLYGYNEIENGLSSEADLPFSHWGTYHLKDSYADNCYAYSDALTLHQKTHCQSHGIYFGIKYLGCELKGCDLIYNYYGYVINQNNEDVHLNGITPNQECEMWDVSMSSVVPAQGAGDISFSFKPNQINFNPYTFDVSATMGYTNIIAQLNIDMDSLSNPGACFKDLEECERPHLKILSENPLIYHFYIPYIPNMINFELLSNVGSIIEYNYNPNNGFIEGIINFAQALSANITEEDMLCFDITACDGYRILACESCISLADVLWYQNNKTKTLEDRKANTMETYTTPDLFLVPNPAHEQVRIEGLDITEVETIRVLDTKGTELYNGKELSLRLENYPPSLYIVVVQYTNGEVDYLKLIIK